MSIAAVIRLSWGESMRFVKFRSVLSFDNEVLFKLTNFCDVLEKDLLSLRDISAPIEVSVNESATFDVLSSVVARPEGVGV